MSTPTVTVIEAAAPAEFAESAGAGLPTFERWGPDHARALAVALLRGLPDRLAHSLRAGMQARQIASAVAAADEDLLVSAALLHDIGYAAALRQTGFHPVDGARFLVAMGAPDRLAALIAHHSESRLLADAAGLCGALVPFRCEGGPVTDALIYADMTAGPRGAMISVADRLADIAARHAGEDPALLAARLARTPWLLAAVGRVEQRIGVAAA